MGSCRFNIVYHSILRKTLVVVFGLCLGLVFAETALQGYGFVAVFAQNYQNRARLRVAGECRIVCLGESTTAGQYPPFLEKILNDTPGGRHFTVIDKGVPGTDTATILSKLADIIDTYQPDIVITMMGINDIECKVPYDKESWVSHLKLYRFLMIMRKFLTQASMQNRVDPSAVAPAPARRTLPEHAQAELCLYQGDVERAQALFQQARDRSPDDYRIYVGLGEVYRRQGKLHETEEMFKAAVAKNPANRFLYVLLGSFYSSLGRVDDARATFSLMMRSRGEDEEVYTYLQNEYVQNLTKIIGRSPVIEEFFTQAIRQSPGNSALYELMAGFYMEHGEFAKAEDALEQMRKLNADSPRYYAFSAMCALRQKQYRAAEHMLEQAISRDPSNDRLVALRGRVCELDGRSLRAREYFSRAEALRVERTSGNTRANYRALVRAVAKRKIPLLCVQYPVRSIRPLRMMLSGEQGIVFVDNERLFKEAIAQGRYDEYFVDCWAGDFGHCTDRGNRLLAENIARTIFRLTGKS